MRLVMKGVLQSQDRSPRLPEEVHLAEVERLPYLLDLRDEARHLPERRII
jgi:hypothetical protein